MTGHTWRLPPSGLWVFAFVILVTVSAIWASTGDKDYDRPAGHDATSSHLGDSRGAAEKVATEFYLVGLRLVDGRWRVRLLTRALPLEALVCSPDSPAARLATDVFLAHRCAKQDKARVPSLTRLEELVARVEQEFSDELRTASKDTIRSLEFRIDTRFKELMVSAPWMDDFAAAWTTHVVKRSPCYMREKKRILASRKDAASKQGITCGDWLTYLGFCTADSDDLSQHVSFDRTASPPPEVVRVITSLAEAGLPDCLGRIVLEDDPELARMVRSLRLRQSHRPRTDLINRRTRLLWRARGVDRWFERTVAAGEVPEDVRREIEACAAGKLPSPVGTARGSGDPGPDRREGR